MGFFERHMVTIMFVSFENLMCAIVVCKITFILEANTMVIRALEYIDPKTIFNNYIKLEMWRIASDDGM